jgi:hypothetical protein
MFYAISWLAVLMLLGAWSLMVWALHALASWTLSSAGALSGATAGAGGLSLPDWLAPWVPPEALQWVSAVLSGLGPVVESLLEAAPALSSGLALASWVVWGIGCALLVMLGMGLHGLIVLWRRRSGAGPRAMQRVSA